MQEISNPLPTWVRKTLREIAPAISRLGPLHMPLIRGDQEWCGHYGCVFETGFPDRVMKITSDPAEAQFVVASRQIQKPRGIVQYYEIFKVPGVTVRGRPVHVLWRQRAERVGELHGRFVYDWREKSRERTDLDEGATALFRFRDFAAEVRAASRQGELKQVREGWKIYEQAPYWGEGMDLWNEPAGPVLRRWRGAQRMAVLLAAAFHNAFFLETSSSFFSLVGEALRHYLEEGILLADVHLNNIGWAPVLEEEPSFEGWIITDPGHAVFLRPMKTTAPRL